jgi:hypothetical protein
MNMETYVTIKAMIGKSHQMIKKLIMFIFTQVEIGLSPS